MKGQSAIAVRKEAGISYVKPTESQQIGVSEKYDLLTSTVFQCSYNIKPAKINTSTLCDLYSELADQPLLLAYFESHSEHVFKEFILNPHGRLARLHGVKPLPECNGTLTNGGLYVIRSGGLSRLGPFASHESFVVIFLFTDPSKGIRSAFYQKPGSIPTSLQSIEQTVICSDL